ncbi:MAG: extracellular solute-binding protein [Chloroflexi bacterium]|nr:extracellular solute-binding protein [Chloroflexota bacterium]
MSPERKSYASKMLERRAFLKLAGVGGGAAFLAACGKAATPAPTTLASTAVSGATVAPATAVEPVTLAYWTPGGSAVWCSSFDTIAANYHEINPNVSIGAAQCYAGEQSFNEVLLANIAAGTPPDATIIWTSPVAFAVRGALEPLDAMMAGSKYSKLENWPTGVLASCQFRGATYGLPVTAGAYGFFYNQELFESKGIPSGRADFPKTWEGLRQLSKEFTHWNGDTLETAGFFPWGDPANPSYAAVELAIWSATNGSQLFDAVNLKYTLNSEQNIEMMQYALDWLEEEYKGDFVKITTSGNWSGVPDAQGRPPAFQEGRMAMLTNGNWFCGDMYGSAPTFKRWDAAQFPVGPSGSKTSSGYWPNWLVIPKGAAHVQEAFNYMDYISGEGILVWFALVPDLPANKAVPSDLVPTKVVEERGQEFAEDIQAFFRGQLDVATAMWTSPVQDFGNDQIGRAIQQILGKQATPEEALTEAQKLCQTELDTALASA